MKLLNLKKLAKTMIKEKSVTIFQLLAMKQIYEVFNLDGESLVFVTRGKSLSVLIIAILQD